MKAGRIALGVTFMSIGLAHTAAVKLLAAIVPDYLPAHRELVLISVWTATAAGVALLRPSARRPAAWFIVLWLLAVFPANIWMAQQAERYRPVPGWALWARLPFQLPMIWWAYLYTRPKRELPA